MDFTKFVRELRDWPFDSMIRSECFFDELATFFRQEGIGFTLQEVVLKPHPEKGLELIAPVRQMSLLVVPVPLAVFSAAQSRQTVFCIPAASSSLLYLYEDRWRSQPEYWQARLRVRLGKGRRIFARKCHLIRPDAVAMREFLQKNHTYGVTRSRCRYALTDEQGRWLAAATFSAPRWMDRGGERVQSWEWIRYASLPDLTVVGGMSRLLAAFVEEVHPQEVMTYADLEWSPGAAYEKMGFEAVSHRPGVVYCVCPTDWSRHSLSKIQNDRRYRSDGHQMASWPRIQNLGSVKYLRRYPF